MLRSLSVAFVGLGLLVCGLSFVKADDKAKKPDDKTPAAKPADAKPADDKAADAKSEADPEAALKAKGLKRLDPFFALADEAELNKKMAGLDKLKKAVVDGQKLENRAERDLADKQATFDAIIKKRIELRAQLPNASTVETHNRIVEALNQMGDQAVLLQKELTDSTTAKQAQATANKAREAYVQQLLEIRQLANRLQEKYADLAADPTVADNIDAYNKAHDKKLKLGPSASLTSNDRKLKKFEETVLSDAIDIHRTGGELWEVSVVFNGKDPQIIDLDTGASMVALSYQSAKAAGLTPSPTDETIELQLADGHVIEAKKVVANSIRVGKFELEKVDVAVMPANLPNAASMLGQSFLKHFSYKIDTEKSKLVMIKVDAAPNAAAAVKPKASE